MMFRVFRHDDSRSFERRFALRRLGRRPLAEQGRLQRPNQKDDVDEQTQDGRQLHAAPHRAIVDEPQHEHRDGGRRRNEEDPKPRVAIPNRIVEIAVGDDEPQKERRQHRERNVDRPEPLFERLFRGLVYAQIWEDPEIDLKALELTQLRVVANEGKHGKGKPDPASSVLKIKGSEIQQATTELLMEVIGPFAAPYDAHGDDDSNETMDWTAQIAPGYFNNRKVSIYGGSNEIQRNIISKAILGL